MGTISNSTYDVAMDMIYSYGPNITHDNVKTVRNYLFQNTVSDYDNSTRGVTKEEIQNFLISKGMTTTQANMEIAALETLGNDIVFFGHAYSSSSKIWIYAEQE